jgi:hypothetical protein
LVLGIADCTTGDHDPGGHADLSPSSVPACGFAGKTGEAGAPPAFRVGCNGSCGPHAPQLLFSTLNERLAVRVSVRQSGWQVWDGEKKSVGNGASQKAWGTPRLQSQGTVFINWSEATKVRGAPFVYPASDLTTHVPYDYRRRHPFRHFARTVALAPDQRASSNSPRLPEWSVDVELLATPRYVKVPLSCREL